MKNTALKLAMMTTALVASGAYAQDATLTIESWRNDDLKLWQEQIIPAFEAANPGIKVNFTPSAPAEYNAVLNSKLDAGSAGDLIPSRPLDASLALYDAGHLSDLNGLDAMSNFSDVAKSAWQTDDGSATFCVPMASVIHGFIYNKDAFAELGIDVPETEEEFFAALDAIKEDGSYIPMAMGTNDQWEAATMGYNNIGPTARISSRLAVRRAIPPVRGKCRVSTTSRTSKWAPSSLRFRTRATLATSRTTRTSASA